MSAEPVRCSNPRCSRAYAHSGPCDTPQPASRSRATAKAAGKGAERAVVDYLRVNGARHAERRLAGSTKDRGDVAGIPDVVIEIKSPGPGAPMDLAGYLTEALAERDNDGATIGLVVVRRRRCGSPGQWFWLTDGETMIRLLHESGWLPDAS